MKNIEKEWQTEQWKIAAGDAEAIVSLKGGTLFLEMSGAASGMDFKLDRLCGVTAAGQKVRWVRIICSEEQRKPDGSLCLAITMENPEGTMRCVQEITVFSKFPFIRTCGRVENIGSEEILIDGCEIFSLLPWCKLPLAMFHVEQFSAKYSRDFFRPVELRLIEGRAPHEIRMGSYPSMYWQPTSCAWFALLADKHGWYDEPPENGKGIVCGIEFNGKSRILAWADSQQAHIVSRIDELNHCLKPGCVFEVPAVFLGRFDGDWDEAGYATQRFAEAYVHPPMPDEHYPWAQYNSWAYEQDICEAQQLQAIDRCAQLGLELAVLDLGWARKVGDWRPDPEKFPRGLKPLAERAKSYGMRFGVHIALAQCSLEAQVAKEHPDWLVHRKVDYFGAASLCLGHVPCREWLIESLSRLIEEEGVEYIVQDGEDMVKYCRREDHTHGAEDSNYSNSQYGLDLVIDSLRKRYPHLVIENCEDGGCMMTYKMARLYHTSITVDNIDTYSTRQGVYGASYPFSPRYSVRYMQDAPTRYTLYSSIFGGPLILMHRLTEWSEAQMEETRRAVELYKELRTLIRDGKIIHLNPPRNNIPGGGWGWDAIEAVSSDQSRGVMMVYRARGDAAAKTLYPRGLQAEGLYRLQLSGQNTFQIFTGAELEKDGITLELPEFGAEIVCLTREKK